MDAETFYRTTLRKLDERITQTDQSIIAGTGVPDWTTYQILVGKRRALLDMRTEIQHIWDGIFKREPISDRSV